jgi:very-short-patch-repair endonuclease
VVCINNKEFSLEELQKIVKESVSKTEVSKKLGYIYYNGSVAKAINSLIVEYHLSIDHLDKSATLRAKLTKYVLINKKCPVCQTEFKTSIGSSEEKRTCSRSCSNTYFTSVRHTEESKKKTSDTLNKYFKNINRSIEKIKVCTYCKSSYTRKNKTKHCSKQCANTNPDVRKKLSLLAKERVNNGTHKGWASRLKVEPSYPEKYVMSLLDSLNISYTREFKVGRWFIDFANIERKLALEIDGKQHELPARKASDKVKDDYLLLNDWKILRIKWKKITKEFREELLSKIEIYFR